MIPLRFLQTWGEQCTCSIINNCEDLTTQQKASPRQHLHSLPGAVSLEGLCFTGCEASGFWDLHPYIPYSSSYSLVGDHLPTPPPKFAPDVTRGNCLPEFHQEVHREFILHTAMLTLPMDLKLLFVTLDNLFNLYASYQPNGSKSYITLSSLHSLSVN